MTSNFRSSTRLISIYVAFLVSGASSLIAEVTWNRILIVVLGNSMIATAMILVVLSLPAFLMGATFPAMISGAALDVVDLNPEVEKINDLFTAVNGDVFHKPRFRFHNDDGRNYLVTSNNQYSVIIMDSTHPRAYDSWILYTEEFYENVKKRLLPGGVFAQWAPALGCMQGDLFRIVLNTYRRAFPQLYLPVCLRL